MTDLYAPALTGLGALQRGLGRGALPAPAASDVLRCVERDHRWEWLVDERAVYLARAVRAAEIHPSVVAGIVRADSDDHTFGNAVEVLGALGRDGDPAAIDSLRRYVRDGPRWAEALEHIAGEWPREHWDDLLPAVRARLTGEEIWNTRPWTDWATVDERIGTVLAGRRSSPRPRPLRETPVDTLLGTVRAGAPTARTAALRELNRRGPRPELLAILERTPPAGLDGAAGRALELLGAAALPLVRRWIAATDHPMRRWALFALAAHGDETDVPELLAGWDRLTGRCGFRDVAVGLARIGGEGARSIVPRLHRLWCSPHSHERAGYLRALLTLDPDRVHGRLTEGLWDCESEVRALAAAHVPLEPRVAGRLEFLADDRMETGPVRAAARQRLRRT